MQQQRLDVPYQTFLANQQFPYNQVGWYTGEATGLGSRYGYTQSGMGTGVQGQQPGFGTMAGIGMTEALGGLMNFSNGLGFFAAEGGRIYAADSRQLSNIGGRCDCIPCLDGRCRGPENALGRISD
jgi:hypothetical protein